MRLRAISADDVLHAVENPTRAEIDDKGNTRLAGPDRRGRAIIVVVAGDDPDFLVTTFPDD
jgi:hypothetical protein